MTTARTKTVVGLLALVLGAVGACNGRTSTSGGSETNWFVSCKSDADCTVGSCLCGVCTAACDDATSCPWGSGLDTCADNASAAVDKLCSGASSRSKGICLPGCDSGTACAKGFACVGGACIPSEKSVASGADAGIGATGSGGATGNGARGGNAPGAEAPSTTSTTFVDTVSFQGDSSQDPGRCLPRTLTVDGHGSVPCTIVALSVDAGACQCDAPGYGAATAAELGAARDGLRLTGACDANGRPSCDAMCGCALLQESGAELASCLTNDPGKDIAPGFCYVDPLAEPSANPAIVANCPATQRRILRFAGLTTGQNVVIECNATIVSLWPTRGHGHRSNTSSRGGSRNPCGRTLLHAGCAARSGKPD